MTKIVGKLETQIFVLDIETKAVKLITSPLALVNHPNWDLTGSIVYFSREQNNNTGLYQYKIQQEREHKLYDDIVSIRMFYPELTLAVDINRQVFQLYPDGSRRFIVQLQNVSSDHWEVVDEYLYFTQIDYDKVNLYRLNLVDLKLDSNSLDVSPAWSRFSMDRSSKRLLVTDTLSRQRDLVQVSW
jgi:hypothetical protein